MNDRAAVPPSSHAPPSLPLSEAAARAAAHCARTPEDPLVHQRGAAIQEHQVRERDQWTRALTGCPACWAAAPAASNRRIASCSAS